MLFMFRIGDSFEKLSAALRLDIPRPFHVDWVLDLKRKCKEQGVALFVKQLGSNPVWNEKCVSLKDFHGGDWDEWDENLRVREVPDLFSKLSTIRNSP